MRLSRFLSNAVVFGILFVVLIGSLSLVQSRMNAIRIDDRLTDTDPLENAPPMVAFTTVALGGFRGLVADWLWLRSTRMQERGNYFEMVQLASWIVKLQPRITDATAFLAWNMSYNISVTFTSFEDRWRWVRRGIELIRDEAMAYNPGDPELFRQLGWMYQHKMGKDLDDANRFYKLEFAKEMIFAFGDYANNWPLLGSAAENEAKLRAALGKDTVFWKMLAARGLTFAEFEAAFREFRGTFPEDLREALVKEGSLETVEICLRRRWLEQKYRLQPKIVAHVNALYGDLDWRLSEAHAIYWSVRGKEVWDSHEDRFKRLQCDRMIFQSLNSAFQAGRLIYLKDINHLELMPNISLVEVTHDSYTAAAEYYEESTVRGAYQNFLVEAVVTLYKFAQRKKADDYFKEGRREFPSRFTGSLEEFVLKELAADLAVAGQVQAQNTVQGYLLQMCYAYALGELEQADTYELIARRIHEKYMKQIAGTEERRGLAPFEQMKRNSVSNFMSHASEGLTSRLRQALPPDFKYDEGLAPEKTIEP